MSLTPLPPAVAANIADDRLIYEWDEWDVHEYFDFPDEALEQRLTEISGRGSISLALAIGEWICHRYSRLSRDPAPMQHLEASWAEQMKPDASCYMETEDDEWRGVIRGPLSIVMTIANDALFCMDEDENTSVRAAWMTNLARHVLPRHEEFEAWLAIVVDRLALLHPQSASENDSLPNDTFLLGRPVPRELFDTLRTYDVTDESLLIQNFLASVDPLNPFLAVNAVDNDDA